MLWLSASMLRASNFYLYNICLVYILFALACQLGLSLQRDFKLKNPGIKLTNTPQ